MFSGALLLAHRVVLLNQQAESLSHQAIALAQQATSIGQQANELTRQAASLSQLTAALTKTPTTFRLLVMPAELGSRILNMLLVSCSVVCLRQSACLGIGSNADRDATVPTCRNLIKDSTEQHSGQLLMPWRPRDRPKHIHGGRGLGTEE